jgi:hypothetical protein
MLKLAVVLIMLTLVFGVVFGSGAALDVMGGTIQVAEEISIECDLDGVDVDRYGRGDCYVTHFVLRNINSACSCRDIFVYVTNNGTTIAEGSAHIPEDGSPHDTQRGPNGEGQIGVRVWVSPYVHVDDITDIDVLIGGPCPD